MDFKTLLLLGSMVGLVACSKAPVPYVEAAERMANDVCKGIVTDKTSKYEKYFEPSERVVVKTKRYYFTCIAEKGSTRIHINFKDIPVKYFKTVGGEDK